MRPKFLHRAACIESPRLCRGTFLFSHRHRESGLPAEPGAFLRPRGMTLVELLLVLALLVIIGSLVVPVFVGSFSSVRLRRAGDEVLARWAQARGRAIETGDIFQFRYASGTGTYQVEPWLPIAQDAAQGGA